MYELIEKKSNKKHGQRFEIRIQMFQYSLQEEMQMEKYEWKRTTNPCSGPYYHLKYWELANRKKTASEHSN